MTKFEQIILEETSRIRAIFAEHNISKLNFTIKATGPTLRDEMKITFIIDGDYTHREVEGASVDATLKEFLRRNNWKKANDYLALPNVSTPPEA